MEAHRVPQGQGGLLPLASALVSCPAKQCNENACGGAQLQFVHPTGRNNLEPERAAAGE